MLKNNSHIKRIRLLLCILLTAAMSLSIIQPLQVHAASDALVKAIVDSIGSSGSAGNDEVKNGITQTRTGYLVYLLDTDGNRISGNNGEAKAYAIKPSASGNWIGGFWNCKSRKGDYTVDHWHPIDKNAWWDMLPWTVTEDSETGKDIVEPNESKIKDWMTTPNAASGSDNAAEFVANLWKDELITEKFKTNQAVLVVETILNLQFSTSEKGMTLEQARKKAENWVNSFLRKSTQYKYNYILKYEDYEEIEDTMVLYYNSWKDTGLSPKERKDNKDALDREIKTRMKAQTQTVAYRLQEADAGKHYKLVGDRLYGTLNTLADYKENTLHLKESALDSYTNRRACFAEYIEQGGIGEQVGFTAWTGAPDAKLTNQEVMQYGVGMMVNE